MEVEFSPLALHAVHIHLAKTDQKANVKGKRYFSSKLNKTSPKNDPK